MMLSYAKSKLLARERNLEASYDRVGSKVRFPRT
jgi:hypothetical protein